MDVLFDDAVDGALPDAVRAVYGGGLEIGRDCVYANFVSSLDGVVATDARTRPANISSGHAGDRFVMGLLRALADCVLIGAGTLRAEPNHQWTPAHIAPEFESSWAQLRRERGLTPEPRLAVATRAGVDRPDALIVAGGPHEILSALRRAGCRSILCEAGPKLFTQLARENMLDELFLTLSPVLAGSASPHLTLGQDARLDLREHRLRSVRRDGSHLLLRYALRNGRGSSEGTGDHLRSAGARPGRAGRRDRTDDPATAASIDR